MSPKEIAKANALAAKIVGKVDELLAPMESEMRIRAWQPEFRAIMWEAIAFKALAKAKEAHRG